MNKSFVFRVLALGLIPVFLPVSLWASSQCMFEDTPVCAIPQHCGQAEYVEGKVPYECDVGQSFKTRCTVKPSLYIYQYEGKCAKPRPKERIVVLMKDLETCKKPKLSGNKAVAEAKKKGLKFPAHGFITAEFSEGSYYPDKPFPGCLWSLQVAESKSPDADDVRMKPEVYFVNGATGEVSYFDPKKPAAKKKKK